MCWSAKCFLFSKSAHSFSGFKGMKQPDKNSSVLMLLPWTNACPHSRYYKLIRELLTISILKTYEADIFIW